MGYWRFPSRQAADDALPMLPPGANGPEKWDNPVPLLDGSWIIAAYPGQPVPTGGAEVSALQAMLLGCPVRGAPAPLL